MKIRNVFGTKFQGTLDKSLVASSWRGIAYLKSYRKPRDPKTEGQREQRGAFADAVAAWQAASEDVKEEYRRRAPQGMSGYNLFIRERLAASRE